MFEDTVNRANPVKGRINMSNLCSEILQVNTPSVFNEDLTYEQTGKDISCNLGSMNIATAMDGGNLGKTVEIAVRGLTAVSTQSSIDSVPSVKYGNDRAHAIGLGQMNLHGYLGRERIHYGSEEGIDFTNIYFYTVLFHAIAASNAIAKEQGASFEGFADSKYASGEFFDKYTDQEWVPATARVAELFADAGIAIPTQDDWRGEGLGAGVRHLQPEPPGRAAHRFHLVHQQLDLVDPPDRLEDRDPQGRQAGSCVLPGALHGQRQPGVLPGRVRDRPREDHRHLRRCHPARGPGPVADAVLPGHRHHA
ncbi:hypothetical protein GCM10025876_07970 [Demequina litorisediminis]|uniref:Ribonucleotide reductase large subunit C-terminal domain-containing protein n=1 Tax=Demequina litorisediminis TaxID=1849022 RepID=A0ABQ6ICY5_9MICO|nr:hypothetical protein GCM10025876_07970 [Demequina litorisediminis]